MSTRYRNLSADVAVSGFTRPEMDTENLAGTVDAYDHHVFLYYNNRVSWPPGGEAADADSLPKLVAATWKARKNDMTLKTKITVCEAREDAGFSDGDVLIFPKMIKYRGLVESNFESFFEDVLVNGKPWAAGVPEVLTGSHVYVCACGSCDVRCGVREPVLINKFNEEIELRGLKDQISVTACSLVVGHKYAENVIIYSPGPDGKTMGHWYGHVTPNDVPDMLDQHIAKGEVIQRLWRGQMGPSVAEVRGADDQKLANGEDTNKGKNDPVGSRYDYERIRENIARWMLKANGIPCCSPPQKCNLDLRETGSSVAEVRGADDQKLANGEDTNKGKNDPVGSRYDYERVKENIARWMLMANGIPCCSPPQKCNLDLREMGSSVAEVRGADGQKLANDEDANKGTEKSKICKNMPVLRELHILTAVGVLGVVASVTVACKLLRR